MDARATTGRGYMATATSADAQARAGRGQQHRRACTSPGARKRYRMATIADHIKPLAGQGRWPRERLELQLQGCSDARASQEAVRARAAIRRWSRNLLAGTVSGSRTWVSWRERFWCAA